MAFPIVPSARASAISGIRAASERLDVAAASVVSQSTWGSDTVSLSAESRAAASSGGGGGAGDVAQCVVDMRVAKYQNAASIAVLRTADEMTQELVSLGKRR